MPLYLTHPDMTSRYMNEFFFSFLHNPSHHGPQVGWCRCGNVSGCLCHRSCYIGTSSAMKTNYRPLLKREKTILVFHQNITNTVKERKKYKQTDRQTDGQTDGQTDRQTDRRTDRHTDRQTHRQTASNVS